MTRRISIVALAVTAILLAGFALRALGGSDDAQAGSPTPTGATADDAGPGENGTVVATDDGRFFFLWNGGKQRIQQPAAFHESDLAGVGLAIGPPAPRVLEVGGDAETRFGSRFVMVPADGPAARLHLLQGSLLHPLDIARIDADSLASVPDLADTVIDRVRIP